MTEDKQDPLVAPLPQEEEIDYRDKYLRLLAEMENMRKRVQKEKQESFRFAVEDLLTEILEPIDRFEMALQLAATMSQEVKHWATGFEMILAQFKEVLTQHGISPFISEGTLFDPRKHEAIETEENEELPEGSILKEYVKGYQSGERVVRPARVKVSKKKKTQQGE